MKRLKSVFIVAALLLALSASYLVWAGPPKKVKICHVTPAQNFIMLVPKQAVNGHLNHGDCLKYKAEIDKPGRPCKCGDAKEGP